MIDALLWVLIGIVVGLLVFQQPFGFMALLGALPGGLPGIGRPERVKAVLRVGEDEWVLAQRAGEAVTLAPTAWRRDNRIEVQLAPGEPWHPEAWDDLWLRACRR